MIRLMESIISELATREISFFFKLVYVDEETCLNLILSETPKTGFIASPLLSLQSFNFNQTFMYAFDIVNFVF